MNQSVAEIVTQIETPQSNVIPLSTFISDFGDGLLNAVSQQNPPVYDGTPNLRRQAVMETLKRRPFPAQQDVVQAVSSLLIDRGEQAAIINAEMGTGKTMMAIAASAVMHQEGYHRSLVISPPHLVYKWRREILETVDGARVWVLNGSDTLRKLVQLRALLDQRSTHTGPEFFILGRVRMRMGFHWQPSVVAHKRHLRRHVEAGNDYSPTFLQTDELAACPQCGTVATDDEGDPIFFAHYPADRRHTCTQCNEALWTLTHPRAKPKNRQELVNKALCQIPTIGPKTASRLTESFGEDLLSGMLADNVYEFINLMDDEGELVFSDKQARRMERALGNMEFSFGQGGYQPTEYIKRYLPDGYFDLLVVDEGHEYKNDGSAQGQAMGVLANKVRKTILLTGTLMGGYGDDLFYLLWRIMPRRMIEDGYRYNTNGTLGSASMAFMREHGILKDIYKETEGDSHRTARGKRMTVRTVKAPGFGPKGITRFVLPFTAFLKLKDIGSNVLPPYREHFEEIAMTAEQADRYKELESSLTQQMKEALAKGDTSLLGVVLNVLLAWPDCCFRQEAVKHPRNRDLLAYVPSVLGDDASPKEAEMIRICRENKAQGRRVLVYTTYTGKRDTTARLKALLEAEGFKAAVLRASVGTDKREDWILSQVDRGVDVLITNPELVKTGLDLLDFPTIVFLQTGYNVYTLQQASRRSWRIGQTEDVDVHFLGYAETAQMVCLGLMAKKIAVSQSTSGDMPDTGLDVLNQDGDSIEVALAKQLVA